MTLRRRSGINPAKCNGYIITFVCCKQTACRASASLVLASDQHVSDRTSLEMSKQKYDQAKQRVKKLHSEFARLKAQLAEQVFAPPCTCVHPKSWVVVWKHTIPWNVRAKHHASSACAKSTNAVEKKCRSRACRAPAATLSARSAPLRTHPCSQRPRTAALHRVSTSRLLPSRTVRTPNRTACPVALK